jgi:hypothetical protein
MHLYQPNLLNAHASESGFIARNIAKRRAPNSREAYESIGGGSPIVKLTKEQVCVCACVRVRVRVLMHTHAHVYTYTHTQYTHTQAHTHHSPHMYTCRYIYIYIHICLDLGPRKGILTYTGP